MSDKVFDAEADAPNVVLICGNTIVGPSSGNCRGCSRPSHSLIKGLCTICSIARGFDPLSLCPNGNCGSRKK